MKTTGFVIILCGITLLSSKVYCENPPLITDEQLQVLLQNLGSPEPQYVGISSNIALAGPRAVPSLIKALSSENDRTRRNAAEALGLIKDASSIPALILMAERQQPYFDTAIDALGKIGGPDVATFFIDLLKNQEYRHEKVIYYLGLTGDSRAIPILCKLLEKNSLCAAWALGKFRDPRSRNALKQAVEKCDDWEVYRMAKTSLYKINQNPDPNHLKEAYLKHSAEEYIKADIEIVILKSPEPKEGAVAYIQNYMKQHPASPKAMVWHGPTIDSFVTPAQYDQARQSLLQRAKYPREAEEIVERLLEFAQYYHLEYKYNKDEEGQKNLKAAQLILEIGDNAKPTLEKVMKYDNDNLKRISPILLKMINEKKTIQPEEI